MKKLLLITIIITISATVLSQSCLPEGITFSTQEEIDNFQSNYPNCTEIEGNVNIVAYDYEINSLMSLSVVTFLGGDLQISTNLGPVNLNGLHNITNIEGKLRISNNHDIKNMTGLESLTSIGGNLEIAYNDALFNLLGLNSLRNIGGDVFIERNNKLYSLEGIGEITEIGGILTIGYNDVLKQLTDFNGLTYLKGLDILANDSLESLSDFDALVEVDSDVFVWRNKSLISLTGLDNLTKINSNLIIVGNKVLNNLSSLLRLEEIDGSIVLINNESLTNINGIKNVNAESLIGMVIIDNYILANCHVKSVCDYLVNPGVTDNINNNALGCNSIEEVLEACTSSTIEIGFLNGITNTPNPFTTLTTLEYELKQQEKVKLTIYNQMGKQVYQTQENQPQGKQRLLWNAEGYPDGIYYYTLQVDYAIANGKMLKVE